MLRILDENIFFENAHPGSVIRSSNFAFIVIYQGELILEINGAENKYEFGNIIIIPSHRLYKIINYSSNLKIYIFSCDRDLIKRHTNFNFNKYDIYRLTNAEKKKSYLKFDAEEFSNIKNQLEQLSFYLDESKQVTFKKEITWLIVNTIIYGIFGKLLSSVEKPSLSNSRKEEIVMEFILLLSENFTSEKELKFYADRLNISVKYLSNCVRDITDIPPKSIIAQQLVNEAKNELLNKKNPVNIIASNLGFSDQYSFGKFFKKHTGLSPKNYRLKNSLVKSF
ncbi:helix-turn-helix domain-containing protein [Myroides sp. LJL119]